MKGRERVEIRRSDITREKERGQGSGAGRK